MKAVIFDLDGTLTDSVHLHAKAWEEAFRYFGHAIPFHKIRLQMGKSGDQLLPAFLSKREIESSGDEIEHYRRELFRQNFLPSVKPFAKVRELFERLIEDDWKVALASSAKSEELETYKQVCQISDLLDAQPLPHNAQEFRPNPDVLLSAINRLGRISPEDCIIVGDTPYDAAVARKIHVRSIGFLCGGFAEEDLSCAGFESLYWGTPDLYVKYEDSVFCSKFESTVSVPRNTERECDLQWPFQLK